MKRSAVDFRRLTFADHPQGWVSSAELIDTYVFLAAYELRSRRDTFARLRAQGMNVIGPDSAEVVAALPDELQVDPLSALVKDGSDSAPFALTSGAVWQRLVSGDPTQPEWLHRGRLTLVGLAWTLLDLLVDRFPSTNLYCWESPLASGLHTRHGTALKLLTRPQGDPSGIWPGGLGQALLCESLLRLGAPPAGDQDDVQMWNAVRPRTSVETNDDLTDLEAWFVTGDSDIAQDVPMADRIGPNGELYFLMTSWDRHVPTMPGWSNPQTVLLRQPSFAESNWQMAFRIAKLVGVDETLQRYRHREQPAMALLRHSAEQWRLKRHDPSVGEGSWFGWPAEF